MAEHEPGADGEPVRPGERLRIVLADDHEVLRHGLRLLLETEPDMEVVAQCGDVASAHILLREHRPDVLLLDLNMPGGSALEAIPKLRAEAPETQIVMLTMEGEPALASRALGAGAIGYVLKESADSELVEAIRRAAAGKHYLKQDLAGRLAAERIRRGGWD